MPCFEGVMFANGNGKWDLFVGVFVFATFVYAVCAEGVNPREVRVPNRNAFFAFLTVIFVYFFLTCQYPPLVALSSIVAVNLAYDKGHVVVGAISRRYATFVTVPQRVDVVRARILRLSKSGGTISLGGCGVTEYGRGPERVRLPFGVLCSRKTFERVYEKWIAYPPDRRRAVFSGIFSQEDLHELGALFMIAWRDFDPVAAVTGAFRSKAFCEWLSYFAVVFFMPFAEEVIKEHEPIVGVFAAGEYFLRADPMVPSLMTFFFCHYVNQILGLGFWDRLFSHVLYNFFVLYNARRALPPGVFFFGEAYESAYYTPCTLGQPRVLAAFLGEIQAVMVLVTSGNRLSAVAALGSLLAKTPVSVRNDYLEAIFDEMLFLVSPSRESFSDGVHFLGAEEKDSIRQNLSLLFPQDIRHSPQAVALVSIFSLMIANEIGCDRSQLLGWLAQDLRKRDGWASSVGDIKSVVILVSSLLDFLSGKRDSFFDVAFYREFASLLECASKLENPGETCTRTWLANYIEYSGERRRVLGLPKMTNELKLEISRVNAKVEDRGRKLLSAGLSHEMSTVGDSIEARASMYSFYRTAPLELRDHSFSKFLTELEREVEKDRLGRLASLPAFPLILYGTPGTGKTTMCGEVAAAIRKELGSLGSARNKSIFSVALDDNGWEGFPLHGANVVLFNDLPGVLDRSNKALQERSLASEIRTLVDVEQLRPHLAFEPTSSTIGKGSSVLCDAFAITTNATTLKFDVDVENLTRRFNRGVVCEVSYHYQGKEFTFLEVKELGWSLEEKLARRRFRIARAVCRGNFVSFEPDPSGLTLHEGEFSDYVLRRFREHRPEAERELEVFSTGSSCPQCKKPRSTHISYLYEGGKPFHQKLDCFGNVVETIPLSFESRLFAAREELRSWSLLTRAALVSGAVFAYSPWYLFSCFLLISFFLCFLAFCGFRVLTVHSGTLAVLSDFLVVCNESWRARSWRMLSDYCRRLAQARYVSRSIENWGKILALLMGGGLAAYFAFRGEKKEESKLASQERRSVPIVRDVEPFMQTSRTFSTPLDITYVGVDRVQLLRNVEERYWDTVPRDATFAVANAAVKKLPPDVLAEKTRSSVFRIKIKSSLPDGTIVSNSAFGVSLSANSFIVLRHYFLNSLGVEYDPAREYEITADFGGGFVPLRKVRNPFSAAADVPEIIVLPSNVVLPCPIVNYLPKERLSGSFSGHYFLKETGAAGVDRFDLDMIHMSLDRTGDNGATLETFVSNFSAGRGDCGSLVIAPLTDEISVVAGILCAGQFAGGVCVRTHFIPVSRSLFSETRPLGIPPTVERCLNLGPFSVQSVVMNGRFEQLGLLGTLRTPQNNSMRTNFRRTELWKDFQPGNGFWSMSEEYLPPPRETYGIVNGIKLGPIHYHLKNNVDCIWTHQELFRSRGVQELVRKIHAEIPQLDLGPISFAEALNGSREMGLSSFDASKSVGPSVRLELGVSDRREILNEMSDSFSPEFEELLRRRFSELGSEEVFVPRIVAGADKDELRTASKISVFKIRWFFAADLHDQLWEKVLFFPVVRLCALRTDIFRWVANLNAVSPQWEELYKDLKRKGTRGIDGDFVSFGASKSHEIAKLVALVFSELLDHFTGYTDAQRKMMLSMVRDSVFQVIISRGDVFYKVRGDCDGSWLTLFINSFTNLILWVWAFGECEPNLSYFEETAGRFQGDDNIHTISEKVTRFNGVSAGAKFLEVGYQYTAVDKSDTIVPLRPLDELTFLKRNFAPHPELGIVGQLEVNSIVRSLSFYRKGSAPKYEVMRQCSRSALMEAVLYGRERFNELQEKLSRLYREYKLGTSLTLSYDEELARYRSFGSLGLS